MSRPRQLPATSYRSLAGCIGYCIRRVPDASWLEERGLAHVTAEAANALRQRHPVCRRLVGALSEHREKPSRPVVVRDQPDERWSTHANTLAGLTRDHGPHDRIPYGHVYVMTDTHAPFGIRKPRSFRTLELTLKQRSYRRPLLLLVALLPVLRHCTIADPPGHGPARRLPHLGVDCVPQTHQPNSSTHHTPHT